jgi:hypothetical protein
MSDYRASQAWTGMFNKSHSVWNKLTVVWTRYHPNISPEILSKTLKTYVTIVYVPDEVRTGQNKKRYPLSQYGPIGPENKLNRGSSPLSICSISRTVCR